jgi:hypothetical protein
MRSVLAFFLLVVQIATALKFDLPAQSGHGGKNERCIRNFVSKDQLVVVTAIVSGSKGDGQVVNMHVCSMSPRIHGCLNSILGATMGVRPYT